MLILRVFFNFILDIVYKYDGFFRFCQKKALNLFKIKKAAIFLIFYVIAIKSCPYYRKTRL